ncbi:hypothetical protein KNT58_gp82 [Mycobacterium phage Fortunato]|uniref:Uncharacterized protein n=3 Tax=Coopervirus TaxID=1982898 RepID=A0A5Q2WMT1_9CAUD|nr:hypothetical protein KNT58_gp82 [Mycobacterium phage Fortunato]AOT27293.1 hypothetical protein SEA_FORTUNATO_82 [Mycobacterium phage Fortunato]AXH47447.1 hypothetical protein SEA_HANGMAN_84 [Mycobacterium phage Hangman]QGH80176.1 hypothetical protein SEA_MITHRIL_83 [Mycobacterium phage Mithril]
MVNLLPGPTRDAMTLAKRAVDALERIATAAELPPTRKTDNHPGHIENGWLPVMNPEVGVHAQLGCRLMFDYAGPGPVAVWCNTHDVALPLILGPVVPPLDDADLAELRAKLEGK